MSQFVIGDTVQRRDVLFDVGHCQHVVVDVLPGGFVQLDPPSTGLSYWHTDCLVYVECQRCRGTGRICCVCRSSEEECQCSAFSEGADCPQCGSGGRPVARTEREP